MKFKIARVFHSFLLVAAAGCGGGSGSPDAAPPPDPPDARPIDAALPPDAHPPDLTCAGMDPPVLVVPDPLTIAGFTRSIGASGASPVAGVAVEARQVSDDSVVASDISRNDGAYSLSVVTGAVALTGYLHATADTFFPTNLFPPDPIQKDIGMLTIPLFAKQLLPLLATLAGTELKPGDGVAIVQVHDCAGDGMAGVVVAITGGNADTKIVYGSGDPPLPTASATTTDESGTVYILNIPPGEVTVSGTYHAGEDMHPVLVKSFADEATLTQLHP